MKFTLVLFIALFAITNAATVESDEDVLETSPRIINTIKTGLKEALAQIYKDVLFPAIDNQAKNIALLAAQVLAGISQTGVFGKRGVKDFFTDIGKSLKESLLPQVDDIIKSLSLNAAQLLAQVSEKGLGKREIEIEPRILNKFKNSLKEVAEQVFNDVLFPAVDNQAKNIALLAAQVLAGISQTGVFGKRADFFTELSQKLKEALLPQVDEAIKQMALSAAQALAQFSQKGIGK